MDNAFPETVLGKYGEVVDRLAEVDDVMSVVTDILSAIEDKAAEDSSVVMSLARAGRRYLQTLEPASIDIAEFCRAADVARTAHASAKN